MGNIFEINNQVFGLNFRERRVSSKTRRAMRSEFVTPANSVEMTYDDVCDVNGGLDVYYRWWGIQFKLSGSETTSLASGQAAIGFGIATALGMSGIGLIGGVIAGAFMTTQAILLNEFNRDGSGVWISYVWTQIPTIMQMPCLAAVWCIITDR